MQIACKCKIQFKSSSLVDLLHFSPAYKKSTIFPCLMKSRMQRWLLCAMNAHESVSNSRSGLLKSCTYELFYRAKRVKTEVTWL